MSRHSGINTNRTFWRKSLAFIVIVLLTGTISMTADLQYGSVSEQGTRSTEDTGLNWIPVTSGLPTSGQYYGVCFGDVNNDGKLDVAAQDGGMHTYTGDGLGNFVEESSGLPGFSGTTDIVLADFNNDGNLDVAGAGLYIGNGGEGGSMSWILDNNPGGSWARAAADVNLDGKMDIVGGTDAGVRAWTGDGGIGGNIIWTDSSNGLPVSGTFWGVDVGDINNDGKPDIVAADRYDGIKAWTGNGLTGPASLWTDAYTGTDLPAGESYANVRLGDVNNDGNLDIVSTALYTSNGVRVWLGNGGAGGPMVWTENSSGLDSITQNYLGVSLQDANDDGNLDILATNYQGSGGGLGLRLWLGDGGAGGGMDWTEASIGLPTGDYADVDAGDYNNDGKIDFVVSHSSGVEIWQNERADFQITGYESISNGLPTSERWADVVLEDVNHDGKLDIGFTSFPGWDMGVKVFLGDGDRNWTDSSTGLNVGGGYGGMRFDDLDHDGHQDVAAAGLSGTALGLGVWRGDGNGNWIPASGPTLDFVGGLEKGDMNNDGDTDLATGHYSDATGPRIYLGDGSFGWSSDQGPPASTMEADDLAIGDVNHDGKQDLAASSMDNIGIQVWTGDGSGLADSWVRNDTGLPTTGVHLGLAFGDVNHDGNLDLGAAGFAGGAQGMNVFTGNGGSGGSMNWVNDSSGLPIGEPYGGVEFCDLDLDGNFDIVFAGASVNGGIGVHLGNGGAGGSMIWSDPSFPGLPTTGMYWGIACGDVNNDGLLEIGATRDGGVEVWKPIVQTSSVPSVNIMMPDGMQDWTGNSNHQIIWNMNDLEDTNDLLTVYVNYSYYGGSSTGTIAGPISGASNPNSYPWMTPFLNATDVLINITVIDTDGDVGYDEELVPAVDSSNPIITSTIPSNGQSDATLGQDVIILFNESMDSSSPVTYVPVIPDPGGWSWSWSSTAFTDDTLTGSHNSFSEGQVYQVTVGTGAQDDSDPGNPLAGEYIWNFTTLITNTAPSCSVMEPGGSESWTGSTNHTIEWMMTDTSTPTENLDVYLNYTSGAGSGPIAALIPSGMASPPFTYDWTVDPIDATDVVIGITVVDEGGMTASNTSSQFEVDSTLPFLISTVPLNGQNNVARNANVEASWSEAMNRTATESSFQLYDNTTWLPVPGTASWISNTLVFDPNSDLTADNWYTANFTTQAKDDSDPGNTLTSLYSWSFRTTPISDLQPPNITDVLVVPSPQEVHFNVNVSANISDDFSVGAVNLNVTGPSGISNDSMFYHGVSGRYYLDRSYDEIGIHSFTIWARDSSGNVNSSSGQFEIVDGTRPTLGNLTVDPPSPEIFIDANISVLAQDNYDLYGVWIEISGLGNFSMQYDITSGKYYDLRAYSSLGSVDFWIWANDTSDNWNGTSGSFSVVDTTAPLASHTPQLTWSAFSPLSIDAVVTDNFQLDSVYLNCTDVNSATYNDTMTTPDGTNFSYSVLAQGSAGVIDYFIWANDTNGNEMMTSIFNTAIILDDDPPIIPNINATPSPQEVFFNVNISAMVTDDLGVRSVGVNVTWPDSSWSNESMNPAGGDFFYLNRNYDQLGDYSFTIWANDTSEKWNSSSGMFQMVDTTPPGLLHTPTSSWPIELSLNLSLTASDNILLVSVKINYTDTAGVTRNESLTWLGGNAYSYVVGSQSDPGSLTYFFWANDSSGNSARTSTYIVEIVEPRSLPPENLTVIAGQRGILRLEWDAPTRNDDGSVLTDLRGYNIYRMVESGGTSIRINTQLVTEMIFLDENLGDDETYYYVVRAVNSRGLESDDSNEASGTTLKPQAEDYTWLIILIVIILIIVVLIMILLKRRKREEEEPEAVEESPDSIESGQSAEKVNQLI